MKGGRPRGSTNVNLTLGRYREMAAAVLGRPKGTTTTKALAQLAKRWGVAVAGEMASGMGLTGWRDGEAKAAAYACFIAWCEERGGFGSRDDMETLAHVRRMIASNGRGRYVAWERANDTKAPNVPNALGWRRKLSVTGAAIENDDYNATGDEHREVEYVHTRDVFRQEFCQGREEKRVLDLLKKAGHLRHNQGRNTLAVRLPGMADNKLAQCIVIKASILSDDGEAAA